MSSVRLLVVVLTALVLQQASAITVDQTAATGVSRLPATPDLAEPMRQLHSRLACARQTWQVSKPGHVCTHAACWCSMSTKAGLQGVTPPGEQPGAAGGSSIESADPIQCIVTLNPFIVRQPNASLPIPTATPPPPYFLANLSFIIQNNGQDDVDNPLLEIIGNVYTEVQAVCAACHAGDNSWVVCTCRVSRHPCAVPS